MGQFLSDFRALEDAFRAPDAGGLGQPQSLDSLRSILEQNRDNEFFLVYKVAVEEYAERIQLVVKSADGTAVLVRTLQGGVCVTDEDIQQPVEIVVIPVQNVEAG